MTQPDLPKILCVDDEVRVLDGMSLYLRKEYRVFTANSGQLGLKTLADVDGVAVVISDMRMPNMDGATFLKQVMKLYPNTTRILLTGEPGREAAVSAVNEGQIFRFLTKPCSPDQVKAALQAGVTQHRLMVAEKVLLQETLIGCIKSLIDVLAITNPVAFGRTNRVKRLATEFGEHLGYKGFWQLEASAMLSQLGYISLPIELVEKVYYGEKLTPEEKVLASGVPQVANKLLGHIPRLEPVLQILELINEQPAKPAAVASKPSSDGMVNTGAQILRLVLDYDGLLAQGHSTDVVMQTLRGQNKYQDSQLVDKFAEFVGAGSGETEIQELPLRIVQPGMIFLDDLRTPMGTLLVPKGFEVTPAFLERMRNFGAGILADKVKVLAQAHKVSIGAASKQA